MGINAKDLKNLSRGDLLELLLAQTERVEELEQERIELQKKVETKDIIIGKSGTLAEAALAINRVFQAADRAAAQYLGNVMRLYDEQVEKNAALEREYAKKLARLAEESIEGEAPEAEILEDETAQEETPVETPVAQEAEISAKCQAMLAEAEEKCRAMEQEATEKCEAMVRLAQETCDAKEREAQAKCQELEQATEQTCKDMIDNAKQEANAYYKRVSAKLKKYVDEHESIKALMKSKG